MSQQDENKEALEVSSNEKNEKKKPLKIDSNKIERMEKTSDGLFNLLFVVLAGIPAAIYSFATKYNMPFYFYLVLLLVLVSLYCSWRNRVLGLAYLSEGKQAVQGYFDKQAKAIVVAIILLVIAIAIGLSSAKEQPTIQSTEIEKSDLKQ
ncbi:hypothetical protein [Thalassotalea atypica]|uniref:hypothetical protein n=1 Tax=Thalassotalea atypica TaxID=2054316 RepID=UPI00257427BA|nr:hypothetical protein [Thalassotalea atypica]